MLSLYLVEFGVYYLFITPRDFISTQPVDLFSLKIMICLSWTFAKQKTTVDVETKVLQ